MAGSHLHQLNLYVPEDVDKHDLLRHALDSAHAPPKPSTWRHNKQAPERNKLYTAPVHKEFFSLTLIPKRMQAFAFGGHGAGGRSNVVSLLDMRSLEWTQVEQKVREKRPRGMLSSCQWCAWEGRGAGFLQKRFGFCNGQCNTQPCQHSCECNATVSSVLTPLHSLSTPLPYYACRLSMPPVPLSLCPLSPRSSGLCPPHSSSTRPARTMFRSKFQIDGTPCKGPDPRSK